MTIEEYEKELKEIKMSYYTSIRNLNKKIPKSIAEFKVGDIVERTSVFIGKKEIFEIRKVDVDYKDGEFNSSYKVSYYPFAKSRFIYNGFEYINTGLPNPYNMIKGESFRKLTDEEIEEISTCDRL